MPYKTFGFTEEQVLVRDNVLKLLRDVLPEQKLTELEAKSTYPMEAHQALARAGWLGYGLDEEWGGQKATHKDLVVFVEATSYHHCSATSVFMTNVIYGGMYIQYLGTEEQRKEFLPPLVQGEIKMGVAYTEPQSGSDLAGIQTRAVRDGDDYIITGQKVYITNAHVADYLIVMAKTNPDGGHRGVSLFIVDTKAPGVEIRPMNPMGRRMTLPNEVFFDNVRVPARCLLGGENQGWRSVMRGLNLERVLIAATSSGMCLKMIDLARAWAKERVTFGKRITEYQAISHKLADMQMLAETCRLHAYSAAEMLDAGEDAVLETSIAKVVGSENSVKCADLGIQIMGGAGYMDGPMSRLYRDVRVAPIGGGSSEIMRNVIAKMMDL
ncbi:MAG: acyl-CoA dehydrogenase family protein [Burkholderiaceae bacterium]